MANKNRQKETMQDFTANNNVTTQLEEKVVVDIKDTKVFKLNPDEKLVAVQELPDGGLDITTEAVEPEQEIEYVELKPVVKTITAERLGSIPETPVTKDVSPKAMALQQSEGAMSIFIDRIKQDGTPGEQMVVTALESYLEVMGSSKPLDTATIVREQTRLYTLFKNIGRRTDDFRKAIAALRYFFREHKDGAFHDRRINRGHEALQLSSDDRRAFYTFLQLFKIIASVNDLRDVKKSVDVSRSLTNPAIPAEVKERYVSLFN